MAISGTESSKASARPVTRFVAPGPDVAMHTPTSPVTFAYPSAAKISPCRLRLDSAHPADLDFFVGHAKLRAKAAVLKTASWLQQMLL